MIIIVLTRVQQDKVPDDDETPIYNIYQNTRKNTNKLNYLHLKLSHVWF